MDEDFPLTRSLASVNLHHHHPAHSTHPAHLAESPESIPLDIPSHLYHFGTLIMINCYYVAQAGVYFSMAWSMACT